MKHAETFAREIAQLSAEIEQYKKVGCVQWRDGVVTTFSDYDLQNMERSIDILHKLHNTFRD